MTAKNGNNDHLNLLERMLEGDRLALARLITYVENDLPLVPEIMETVYTRTGKCFTIGVTGPPGAGKSTLVDKLIARLRARGETVGVIAIDPSSPFSGGAILGDRIRMQQHALDRGVFIRSLGTRGTHGGVSRATVDVLRLLDAFGLDVVIIETVGVGQTELDIVGIADTTMVVIVPESGDTVQTMKAGLMEIADIFVVNKADRPGSKRMLAQLSAMVELNERTEGGWQIPVLLCQASNGQRVEDVHDMIDKHKTWVDGAGNAWTRAAKVRRRQFMEILAHRVLKTVELMDAEDERFHEHLEKVEQGKANPYKLVNNILQDEEFRKRILSPG